MGTDSHRLLIVFGLKLVVCFEGSVGGVRGGGYFFLAFFEGDYTVEGLGIKHKYFSYISDKRTGS